MTFGCKVNQYETQALREAWQQHSGTESADLETAQVVVFNSCAITAGAVADVRKAMRRARRLNSHALFIVTGCAAQLEEDLTFIHELQPVQVFTQKDKVKLTQCEDILAIQSLLNPLPHKTAKPLSPKVSEHVDTALSSDTRALPQSKQNQTPDTQNAPTTVNAHTTLYPPFQISTFTRTRPVLKVQDGCSHYCSYCIVPQTRGLPKSRPMHDCLAEAERLLQAGHRELMLSGVNLRQYKYNSKDFWELLAFLDTGLAAKWQGKARLRISSLDPAQLDTKALDILAASHLVCPHLHLSLQSGSPSVLAGMNRSHYTPEGVLDAVQSLQKIWSRFGLGADILMGFPGETPLHVQESLDFLDALPLTYGHVFPYSERPKTRAAAMPHAVPRPERQERASLVREAIKTKQNAFLHELMHDTRKNNHPLYMAVDGKNTLRGVDQYYSTCVLQKDSSLPPDHELFELLPVKACGVSEESFLLVEPL